MRPSYDDILSYFTSARTFLLGIAEREMVEGFEIILVHGVVYYSNKFFPSPYSTMKMCVGSLGKVPFIA